MPRSLYKLLSFMLILSSCSIKEDRANCPCFAYVNIDEFLEAGFQDAIVSFSAGDLLYREKVKLAPFEGCGFEQEMPRTLGRNAVIGGIKNCAIYSDSLYVPVGVEYDPIWLFSDRFECNSDRIYVDAVPSKQYCNITIIVDGLQTGVDYNLDFRVNALCNGLDMYSMSVLEGPYSAIARRIMNKNMYSVRLPRQNSSEINLDIISKTDNPLEQKANYNIDIGEMLSLYGYDWTKPNLSDISVLVDYSNPVVKISIGDWNENVNYYNTEI